MRFVSDIHGASSALARVGASGEPLIVLGDLINLTDYRTGEGAVATVLGLDLARENAEARARGDYQGMRASWVKAAGEDFEGVRGRLVEEYRRQYLEVWSGLADGNGWVIHGNVDRPSLMVEAMPAGFEYLHGEVVEVEGWRLGLIGGGVPTPLGAEGETSPEEMRKLLERLGPVDVLGTHIPPAITQLRHDVITDRDERGSQEILDYLEEYQPRYHVFGDVHQPQATKWRVGSTICLNAGYFRATGRYLSLSSEGMHIGRVG